MDARSSGPMCVQGVPYWASVGAPATSSTPTGSEDCLLADVYVPSTPKSSSLPVLVNIHGGGYTLGSAASTTGEAFINASSGALIYVSIQYRLGAFGFLNSAEIRDNGVANAGLLDQRAGLNWVGQNVHCSIGQTLTNVRTGPTQHSRLRRRSFQSYYHWWLCWRRLGHGPDDFVRRCQQSTIPCSHI